MLKGYVFKEQIFEHQVFAFFIDTFLNGECGIGKGYGNEMKISHSGSNVTVQNGLVCIRGRFVGEDSSKTIDAGTETAFCKLVIEIDLDKENTEEVLNQVAYKVIKSTSGYPTLTQTNITLNNSGIYQFELARFKTSPSGIVEFVEAKKYLNFNSIFGEIRTEYKEVLQELRTELANVKDGSAYMLKSMILSGTEEPTDDIGNDGDLYVKFLE